jgi:hypothetical protein
MTGSFGRVREGRRFNWRHEVAPVLAVAGLAADYLSPPAAWTMVLPIAFVVLLLALRKWAFAAAVFLLCSWVLIPTAARAVFAVEETRGKHDAFWIDGVALQSLDGPVADPCVPNYVGFTELPVGPGHIINPRGPLLRAVVSFTELHNLMVLDRWQQDVSDVCIDADALPPDADALPPDADAR